MRIITVRKVYDPGSDGNCYVAIVQGDDGEIQGVQIHVSKCGAISRVKKDAHFYGLQPDPEDEVITWGEEK